MCVFALIFPSLTHRRAEGCVWTHDTLTIIRCNRLSSSSSSESISLSSASLNFFWKHELLGYFLSHFGIKRPSITLSCCHTINVTTTFIVIESVPNLTIRTVESTHRQRRVLPWGPRSSCLVSWARSQARLSLRLPLSLSSSPLLWVFPPFYRALPGNERLYEYCGMEDEMLYLCAHFSGSLVSKGRTYLGLGELALLLFYLRRQRSILARFFSQTRLRGKASLIVKSPLFPLFVLLLSHYNTQSYVRPAFIFEDKKCEV